jgi:broad specificity phosphatase PhoE
VTLYFMRHAESEANALDILGGRIDYALSERGRAEAKAVARAFCPGHPLDAIIASPLLRARQTAEAFARETRLVIETEAAITEQDMGEFAGKTAAVVEADPAYELDKSRRWDWAPPGGESYRQIALRLAPFFARLDERRASGARERILVLTHAVTLRLIIATLEDILPAYPSSMARNAEIFAVEYLGLGRRHEVSSTYFGAQRVGRA